MFRAIRALWRDLGSFGTAVDGTVAAIAAAADRLAASSAEMSTAMPRLEAATAGLRASLARNAVLRAALSDVQESMAGVTALYPRK
jgi:hypothetical protein